ncbi:MAG: GGDEF domain-containing protein [Epsilonproteobacteria bacterium]|nr:MAG: GGDEF domain-containing protein [Campylobacterota bacterium]
MGNINSIVKNTLIELKKKKLVATPDNYFKEFDIQSKVIKQDIYECSLFNDIITKLTQSEQNKIKDEGITTYSGLALLLSQRVTDLKSLAFVLNEIMAPSIQHDIDGDIDKLTIDISKDPKKLLNRNTITKIKDITKKRINNDRKVLLDKSNDIAKLTSLMEKYFDKTLLESGNSSDEISTIKNELESLEISDSSSRELGVLKSNLVSTIYGIEYSLEKNNAELLQNKSQFDDLHQVIQKLQKELDSAKEEKDLDYLTNILNRRAFDQEVVKIEKKHQIFGTNYAIVFYDIDYFKSINDTYGHDCGDAVLRTFAGILKRLTRQEDTLARYGGEEFVVLLNYENENEMIRYLKRVKELISSSIFNYKDHKDITIKFSAGLSCRNKYNSFEETIKKADDLLYEAKNTGRDKILLDSDVII